MSKRYRYLLMILSVAILSTGALVQALRNPQIKSEQWQWADRPPKIRPDYCDTVIPPNIAPLNFVITEAGTYYHVKIYAGKGRPIEIAGTDNEIIIPIRQWRKLLNINRGQKLHFDIYTQDKTGQWTRFKTITNKIADEPIDNYLIYRKIHPVYSRAGETAICQRNLQNYDDTPILRSKYVCVNCHTFCNNKTDKMFIGTRSQQYGSNTLLADNNTVEKIGTKFGYTAWHPNGRMAVYSLNKVRQFFHSARTEVRDVVDLDSTMVYYLVDSKTVKTIPQISQKDRLETFPAWSPDGRYLYFCSAAMLWSDRNKLPPARYKEVKYDLMRISYDAEHDTWGLLETVLSADDTGLSILQPRISPDGRWLLFCMCQYSCWPSYQPSSDLYIMDLESASRTGHYEYHRLSLTNSSRSESWHAFSGNSRWIAFSSKRGSGLFTRIYLGYIDEDGNGYKPILVPQKDPTYYDSCIWTIGVGELVREPVRMRGEKLMRAIRSADKIAIDMPITMATPKTPDEPGSQSPWETWQERE